MKHRVIVRFYHSITGALTTAAYPAEAADGDVVVPVDMRNSGPWLPADAAAFAERLWRKTA